MTALNALLVSHGSGLGGAERVLIEMVEGLDPRAVLPTIAVPQDGLLADRARQMNVPVVVSPAPWWLPFEESGMPGYLFRRYWEEAPRFVQPLADIISRRRIDVVYSASSPILHGALAAHLTRRPHLQHMQDLLGWPHLGLSLPFGSAHLAYRLMGRLSSLVVCVGRTVRDDIGSAIPADKCRIVPLGLSSFTATPNPIQLPDAPPTAIRVGVVGAVERRKGADVIAAIAQRVCAEAPDVHIFWAGSGDPALMARLTEASKVHGVPHVHFLGYTDQVPQFLQAMDFLLHPARNETFPRVLLEGALAGRAYVATRCGGGQEIVHHEVTGLLAPVDDVAAMAYAVTRLAMNPADRMRMGQTARGFAARFDMASYQTGMQQALIDAHRRGPAIRNAGAAKVTNAILRLPGRITPSLRRWATRGA